MTIKEIAKIAGVSKSTVSRVITGSKEVSQKTKEKILQIMQEENYVPNRFAASLSSAKSKVIGIIVPDIKNTFYVDLIDQLELNLQEHGYTIFLCITRGKNSFLKYYFDLLNSIQAEGVFYISPSTDKIDLKAISHIPMITIDGQINDSIPSVICNHRDAIKLGFTTLIEKQCKNILYITGLTYFYSVVSKNMGYERTIDEHKNIKIKKVQTALDPQENYEIIKKAIIKDKTIDGIVCINDQLAFITIRVLRELNLRLSKDVLLIGYDNSSYINTLAPELSSVEIPIKKMAGSAVNIMINKLDNGIDVSSDIIDLELIKRDSLQKKN